MQASKKANERSEFTVFTEVAAIDLILKVIELTAVLHDRNLVHTNLCPSEIFLKGGDVN
jgi:hypothetical protein